MKKIKKSLSLLLVMLVALNVFAFPASAAGLADYTQLDEKIAEGEVVSSYPTFYIIYGRAQFVSAFNAAKNLARNLSSDQQVTVDNATTNLTNTMANLRFRPVDFGNLETTMSLAKGKTASHYENFSAVTVALAKTSTWFNENGTLKGEFDIRDQEAIDAVYNELNSALENLVLMQADYTALDAALAAVPSVEELVVYQDDIVNALLNAVSDSENYRGLYRDSQTIIDEKTNSIIYYTNQLQNNIKPADYSGVDAAIELQPDDMSIYTADSALELNLAVQQVDRTKNITQQAEVDAMEQRILDAIDDLVVYEEPTIIEKILQFIIKAIADVLKWLTNVAVPKIAEFINKNKD